jgi:hypothetical protein
MKKNLLFFSILFLFFIQIKNSCLAQGQIYQAEYFIDTDPGVHNGSTFTFTAADTITHIAAIPISANLPPGKHDIFIRTFDTLGRPSIAQASTFFVNGFLQSAEYFIDTDPGAGNGTAIPITANVDSISINTTIPLPTHLATGMHALYVRTKLQNGAYSIAEAQTFFVKNNIIYAEYFIDADPGRGNGMAIPVAVPSDSIYNNIAIPAANLLPGYHSIAMRTKTSDGKWSMEQWQQFYLQPKIIAYSYWIDSIPQPVVYNPIFLNAGSADSVAVNANIVLPNTIAMGSHRLFVATLAQDNSWSIAAEYSFTTNTPPLIVSTPIKVLLGGCYDNATGLMQDSLRTKNLIPSASPFHTTAYTSFALVNNTVPEQIGANVLTTTGPNAIVDWVLIELRSASNAGIVLQTKSALLQRDGDVVEASDGASTVTFANIASGNYYVAIKHRNHMGVMLANTVSLGLASGIIDYSNTATILYVKPGTAGNLAPLTGATQLKFGKRLLYPGNASIVGNTQRTTVMYNTLASSDRQKLFNFTGGVNTVVGYYADDVDLNGYTRFNGLDNDRSIILNACNGSSTIIIAEQLPN